MVLENFLSSDDAEKSPLRVFFYAILATTISLFIAGYIFPSAASTTFPFLITIASFPIIYNVLKEEENLDEAYEKIDIGFLSIHKKALYIYSCLFLGIVVAASFWYTVLPQDTANGYFSEQIKTLSKIRGPANEASGMASYGGEFTPMLLNNLSVAFISFIMSFFYGVGAIFVLAWNASVIAVFVGNSARFAASQINHPLSSVYGFATALPSGLLSIALHGVPEMLAYFVAGIAGGILSIGVIRKEHRERIFCDAFALFGVSVALIIFAAIIEVWITPAL